MMIPDIKFVVEGFRHKATIIIHSNILSTCVIHIDREWIFVYRSVREREREEDGEEERVGGRMERRRSRIYTVRSRANHWIR
jgi:hypothetical protein